MAERFLFDVGRERLTAIVHRPSKPLGFTLLLGHGMTGGQRGEFIGDYAAGLSDRGVLVVTYEFPFAAHGRRSPDPNMVLEASCRRAAVAARQCRPRNLLFLGGKSLGGRVASEVVATGGSEVDDVAGVVLLGYPLHTIGRPEAPQWRHLGDVRVPVLIVQGTRDVFGTPMEIRPVLTPLPRGSRIFTVDGGDHSFTVPTRGGRTQADVHAGIQDEIVQWMSEVALAYGGGAARAGASPR